MARYPESSKIKKCLVTIPLTVDQRAVKVKDDAEVFHSFREAKHSGMVFNVLDPVVLAPSKAIIAFVVECHRDAPEK